jgi:hypothetical protein
MKPVTGLMGTSTRSYKTGLIGGDIGKIGANSLFFFGSEKFFFSEQAMIDISRSTFP